ncbi:uncharacterized protein K452DRAFT_104194 [Aplosporella prunicola CBS 121167]|uniref:Probable aspartic-type endopeptidase OPSB n=1 Tax=Aplosporella prunicola CBS 121167 TaxID=1176127 RepID=A0A6A6BRX8_9PEZI|nr:uncharacterized protein K452DRAFT_104194 [Aplosporella prunicola CBS 121167]KAF2145974.1 hypothetical protein K452DRAFT_104194 [Aplosporella prunicola CBS 121167]
MKCTAALTLAANLLPLTNAIQLAKRDPSTAPKVLGLDIERRNDISDLVKRDQERRWKRSAVVKESLDNLETLYFANASLGTPKQTMRLHIDTGSSDLWVNSASSSLCSSRTDPCKVSGTYSANDSSTYEYVNSKFNISYVDGSGAAGDYVTDTFWFGSQNLTDMQFGVGYTSSSGEGVLGIGFAINEVAVNRAQLDPYPNLPQLLVNKDLIQSSAYSLWLNDLDASTGSILFGGVDTEKYHGTLQTLPILQENGKYREFVIALTGVGYNGESDTFYDGAASVLLDSGSSLMYLPDDVAESIYDEVGAEYSEEQGAAFIDCAAANKDDTLEFKFSSPTISVPMNELVIVAGYNNGEPVCFFGVAKAGSSSSVLGDTFLRSAYVVYDLENNEISLAATNFNSTSSNVVEIGTGDNAVPNATVVADAVSTVAGSTGGARVGSPKISDSEAAAVPVMTAMPKMAFAAAAGAGLLFAL